ncbi:MAG: hypothetical protein HXY43_06550, partial [Fischerella sp.]|nr:hypothetical protein [Fischerella sp.]
GSHLTYLALMSSTFFTPLIILVLFNLSSYFYTKLDELTLHEIAFDCYSHMLEMAKHINQYAAAKTAEKATPTMEWERLILHISLAFDWIEKEHPREIRYKQLSLF